jgi:hypothetical protein
MGNPLLDENDEELPPVFEEAEYPEDPEQANCDFYGTGFNFPRKTIYSDDDCWLIVP